MYYSGKEILQLPSICQHFISHQHFLTGVLWNPSVLSWVFGVV